MYEPRQILFITLSNIGDAVMTTPVLSALQARYPQARFDIVADARSAALFEHFEALDEIILKHKNARWRDKLDFVWQLRSKRYDLIVDLRTDGLGWLLRAERRLHKIKKHPPERHSVIRHFMAIESLVGHIQPPPARLWISAATNACAADWLQDLPGKRWLALGPGANWEGKVWPAQRFAELVQNCASQFDAVIFLGNAADSARVADIVHTMPLPYLDLTGKSSLLEAAAVLQCATVFVGNDSGLGHLASAVGTPTLTVFGPGEPLRYHPWGERAHWLTSPASDLAQLDVAKVAAQLNTLLNLP
ncbi:MAG: glycosyltransferase family 9 protein [Pseudomonadota bacterium]